MKILISFLIGMCIGGFITLLTCACIVVGSRYDNR